MQSNKNKLLSTIFIFIILQPFLDILSYLSIRGIIPFNISTYVKPIFVFSLGTYLLFKKNDNKKNWFIYILLFIILTIGHTCILIKLLVDSSVIIHEIRFIINIAYMISLFIIFSTICDNYHNKEELLRKFKNIILITFGIYFSLLILSILTGTSSLTYEYSDALKKGFKGWFDSGQILGHAFSIIFPLLIYTILTPKRHWYYRIIIIFLFVVGVSLIGTKVPYYITLIVFIIYIIISIFIRIFNKNHQTNYFNIILIFISIILMISTYRYTPVKYNTDINTIASSTNISEYNFDIESCLDQTLIEEQIKIMYPGKNIDRLVEYENWNIEASKYLINLFKKEKLHPSNMRFKQIYYANKKFQLSNIEYKIFGLGFLNQYSSLAIESDFFMIFYSFGILGFILFFFIPIKEFIKSTIIIIKNLKIVDLETYMIYMGLGIFFCISIYAGYTLIYTNFSIFLVILVTMLKLKRSILKEKIIKKNKVSFLLLHLGYGGIETATVNTANSLCDKYEVELISFYKLNKNQSSRISEKVKVKYLYNGEPNRKEFIDSIKNYQFLKILKEGIKAVDILIKKRILVIKEIIDSNSKFIVSTRYEFSTLLSKYGNKKTIKIAQEHHYHNNNKRYIKIIKNKYKCIDYLFALTKTLEIDYNKFLKHNNHTKVILMPNMLYDIPSKKSNLKNKNIITISRLDCGKKNDEIIKLFNKIKDKDWHLTILGDGEEYLNLQNLIKKLHLEERVSLEGYVAKEKLEPFILNSSIFLMASLTEGLPMVLLEAMSYGIPCIAYETASGVNDIIKNNYNGFVIKNRSERDYIKAIEKLTDNENLRKKMGMNAVNSINSFSKEYIIKKWYEILK